MNNLDPNHDVVKIEEAIQMLNEYAKETDIQPLIAILEELKHAPYDEAIIKKLSDVWNNLGVSQGVVLTYVPYFYTLIPDDIFGDDL